MNFTTLKNRVYSATARANAEAKRFTHGKHLGDPKCWCGEVPRPGIITRINRDRVKCKRCLNVSKNWKGMQ